MKCTRFLTFVTLCVALCTQNAQSAPTFVTGRMMDRRNGLTDKQYEYLWSIGKNPQISQNTARDWMYRADRYQNVTNWLDICGATNNFAALSYTLQRDNFIIVETNTILRTINQRLISEVDKLVSECSVLSNAITILDGQLAAATSKINDEITDLEAKVAKYEEYKTKYPLFKTLWTALINDAQNRIKILQALTGSNT